MPRLAALLPLLALAGLASAQNASSTAATNATATSAGGAATAQETVVTLPAYPTSQQGEQNSTITAVWSTDAGRGTLTQGLTLLQNSTSTASNGSIYGLLLEFNSSLAVSNETTATQIPWIAYISCDDSSTTFSSNGTSNATSSVGIAGIAATSTASATGTAANATVTGVRNVVDATNSTEAGPETYNLINVAQGLGAKAVLLYSRTAESCALNLTALANSTSSNSTSSTNSTTNYSNSTMAIFTAPSTDLSNLLIQQFSNLPAAYTFFNSSLIAESTGNLTSLLSAATNGSSSTGGVSGGTLTAPTNYLLARIVPYYVSNASDNGVVATIGRASPTSSTGGGATGSVGQGSGGSNAAPAARKGRSKVVLAATGFVAGALIAGVGVLV
ncbi:hypothetical protein JCM8097_006465 [Rhodosporidiobolus ruineniae]